MCIKYLEMILRIRSILSTLRASFSVRFSPPTDFPRVSWRVVRALSTSKTANRSEQVLGGARKPIGPAKLWSRSLVRRGVIDRRDFEFRPHALRDKAFVDNESDVGQAWCSDIKRRALTSPDMIYYNSSVRIFFRNLSRIYVHDVVVRKKSFQVLDDTILFISLSFFFIFALKL